MKVDNVSLTELVGLPEAWRYIYTGSSSIQFMITDLLTFERARSKGGNEQGAFYALTSVCGGVHNFIELERRDPEGSAKSAQSEVGDFRCSGP